jgi:hypothetical protein
MYKRTRRSFVMLKAKLKIELSNSSDVGLGFNERVNKTTVSPMFILHTCYAGTSSFQDPDLHILTPNLTQPLISPDTLARPCVRISLFGKFRKDK